MLLVIPAPLLYEIYISRQWELFIQNLEYTLKVFVAIFSVVCTLVLPSKLLASDWFDIFISRDTVELTVGDNSSFTLNFIQHDSTFSATLFLGAGIGNYMFLDGDGTWKPCLKETSGSNTWLRNPPLLDIPTNAVNKPYKPLSCSIKANQADTGFYRIYITINNNNKIAKDSLYIRVKPIQNWYLLELKPHYSYETLFPSYLFVTQDTSYHNYYQPTHEHTIGSDNNKRRLIYTGSKELNNAGYVTPFMFNKKKEMVVELSYGLLKYDRNYKTLYNDSNSPFKNKSGSNYIMSQFAEDVNGIQYWANDVGAYAIEDGEVVDLLASNPDIFHELKLSSIYSNPKSNDTYFATDKLYSKRKAGIYHYNGVKWDTVPIQIDGISNDSIMAFYELKQDKLNNLWALVHYYHSPITMKKLVMFDGNRWIQFPALDSIPLKENPNLKYEAHFKKFEFDMHGDIWLLSGWRQLVQFDGVSIKNIYNDDNSPISVNTNVVPFFIIDSSNTFYFASDAKGWKYLQMFNPDGIPLPLMSQPSAVEEEIQPPISGITISPNPTSTSLTISGIEGVRSMQMVNTLGMVVGYESLGTSSTHEVDVSNLPNGMYSIQFHTATGIISKPVVVNR